MGELLYLDRNDTTGVGLGAVKFGQQTSNNSVPVVLPSDQTVSVSISSAVVQQGAKDASAEAWIVDLTKVGGSAFALGQQLAAASLPVVLTAAQITTLTPPAAITGFATEVTLGLIKDTDGIKKIVDPVAVTGTFWQATQPISAASLPLPTGAATSALQLPDGHNVTVDNVSIAVTGTFWQTTQPVSLASVPSHAVTNAGTFAVQADSVIPGFGATNLGKREDDAHASLDTGVMALGVRKATPIDLSGADGDYEPFQVDNGRMYINPAGDFPTFIQTTSTSTSAVQINSASTQIRWISIKALPTNIEAVWIGGSGVTAGDGTPLLPTDPPFIYKGNSVLNQWYFIKADATSQGVAVSYA